MLYYFTVNGNRFVAKTTLFFYVFIAQLSDDGQTLNKGVLCSTPKEYDNIIKEWSK